MRLVAAVIVVQALLITDAVADPGACEDELPVYADGAARGRVCRAEAAAAGLTIIDLSASWTPGVLAADGPGAAPAYRDVYLALAEERYADAGADHDVAVRDGYLEIYGILPTLDIVRARLDDSARHRCHGRVDDAALRRVDRVIVEEPSREGRARVRQARSLRAQLEREAAKRELADLDALAASSAYYRRRVDRLRALETRVAAVIALQQHLVCDGLLEARRVDGAYTWRSSNALEAWQRRHMLVPDGRLGEEVGALMTVDSRELDFRSALRVLRERVIDATTLVEDGSAGSGSLPVLGRKLDPADASRVRGHEPLPDAAPDLISPATEAVAHALGWTGPRETSRFLGGTHVPAAVAVRLPPAPAYHAGALDLEVEIDRGDVWYDTRPRSRRADRRPALTLYARDGERRIPLVRWPTTIGGWQDEKLDDDVVESRWKESPIGARVWRSMYVAPTWLPPASTPDADLVRSLGGGAYELRRDALGPSYRSAYGLVMLVHERPSERRGQIRYLDEGIRTHGTSTVQSLATGTSHGCHRLFPHHALRLGGFLLRHRDHDRVGETATRYVRTVRHHGRYRVEIDSRGYQIDFHEPIPVEVLEGTIRSKRRTPARP